MKAHAETIFEKRAKCQLLVDSITKTDNKTGEKSVALGKELEAMIRNAKLEAIPGRALIGVAKDERANADELISHDGALSIVPGQVVILHPGENPDPTMFLTCWHEATD
jgi:hypothetical protein